MWREVNPDTLNPNYPTHTEQWTDYMGQMPYADFEMTLYSQDPNFDVQVAEQTRYLAAAGVNAQQTVVDPNTITRYFHGDLIDSTMLATDGNGTAVSSLSYTAFGEPIGDPNGLNTRYQYAGGYGYESDLLTLEGVPGSASIALQHVGARWYQPDIGRFVQRDPIGIRGGLNLYAYAENDPLSYVDPDGLCLGPPSTQPGDKHDEIIEKLDEIIRRLKKIEDAQEPKIETCIIIDGGYTHKGSGIRVRMKIPIEQPNKSTWEKLKKWWKKRAKGLGGSSGNPVSCFIAGTEVLTQDGTAPVEELAPGDCVVSWDQQRCLRTVSEISAIYPAYTTELVHISIRGDIITCTPEHPFYVDGCGWVRASDLTVGDELVGADGGTTNVLAVEHELTCTPVRIYNISVNGTHTFYVGNSSLLVHNKIY